MFDQSHSHLKWASEYYGAEEVPHDVGWHNLAEVRHTTCEVGAHARW